MESSQLTQQILPHVNLVLPPLMHYSITTHEVQQVESLKVPYSNFGLHFVQAFSYLVHIQIGIIILVVLHCCWRASILALNV